MTDPDKSETVDDKRDKGDAKSDFSPVRASANPTQALSPTESSDTIEERRKSSKLPEDASPVWQPLPEGEYSEGEWIKWDPADVYRRALMLRNTAPTPEHSPAEAASAPESLWVNERLYSTDYLQHWDNGTISTEDRNSGGGPSSDEPSEDLRRTAVPLGVTPEPKNLISTTTISDSQSFRSIESCLPYRNEPGIDRDEEARHVYEAQSLAIYDTETGESKRFGGTGTSTVDESGEPDTDVPPLMQKEASGKLSDNKASVATSPTSSPSGKDLMTLKNLSEHGDATPSRPLPLTSWDQASSTTQLVQTSPAKADAVRRDHERDWHGTVAAGRTRIPSCLLLFNLFLAFILVLMAHLQTLHSVLHEPPTASSSTTTSYRPDRPVCQGVHCSGAGTHLFYTLNRSADPCRSAFDLVCRPWVRQTPANYRRVLLGTERIFVDRTLLEIDKLLRSQHPATSESKTSTAKLALLYDRCMDDRLRDNEGLDYFRNVMRRYELHQWPYHDGDVLGQPRQALKRFVYETGSDPYFKVQLRKNSSHSMVLAIDCPSLGLPPMSFVNGTVDVEHYIEYAKTIIQETSANAIDARNVATSIVQFETDLARLHVTHCNDRTKYSQRTTDELRADKWNWKEFLSFITGGTIDQDIVLVRSWEYLNHVIALIESNNVDGANYLGWKVASRLLPYTTTHIATITEKFLASTGLQARPTFQQCLAQVNQVIPFAMGRLYVKATHPTSTSYSAFRVAYHLIQGLDRKVKLERWLGHGIESSYRRFRSAMGITLAYPSWIDNDTLLDAHYASVHVTNSYLESHMSAATTTFRHTLDPAVSMRGRESLLFPNDVRWTTDPSTPPMYDLLDNHVYLLPAVLQPPHFVEETAPALNFGGLGFLLAGDLVDEVVSLRKGGWTGLEVTTEMQERFKCLAGRLQDSVATSLLGTKLAYLSYQMNRGFGDDQALRGLETMSPDQLFFVAIARSLCSTVRDQDYVGVVSRRSPIGAENLVDAVLLNLPEYLDAFNCTRDWQSNDFDICFRK